MKLLIGGLSLFISVAFITCSQVAAADREEAVSEDAATIQVLNLCILPSGKVVLKCKNIGSKPVKAFKGKWVVFDDFNEASQSDDILFTSNTPVMGSNAASNALLGGYLIQPDGTIYLLKDGEQRVAMVGRPASDMFGNLEDVPPTWKKRFKAVITNVIFAEREDIDNLRKQEEASREQERSRQQEMPPRASSAPTSEIQTPRTEPTRDAAQVFSKGAQVQLSKDTPLLFKSEQIRIGRVSETFTVIQHDTTSKRVFVLAIDSAGRQVALNVAEDAVEFAAFDVAKLRATLIALSEKTDFLNAKATVEAAAVRAPNDARIQEYRTSILAAKTAHDRIIAAGKRAEDVRTRVAQLSKSAWAARNNFLDANGGFARSQEMKAEADKLIADANKENAEAKTEWESAKSSLSSVISKPIAATSSSSPKQ